VFLISNIRPVLNVVFLLLGDYPASEFYMLTFRNILFHLHRWCKLYTTYDSLIYKFYMPTFRNILFHLHRSCKFYTTYEDRTDNISKRRHIKFRRHGIAQNKEWNLFFTHIVRRNFHFFSLITLCHTVTFTTAVCCTSVSPLISVQIVLILITMTSWLGPRKEWILILMP
jgi:hypothetical protein